MNFKLTHVFNHSLEEFENMLPFERDILISLIIQYLEEEKQKNEHGSQ